MATEKPIRTLRGESSNITLGTI